MNSGPVSTRYATALLDYSIEKGDQDEVYMRMKLLVGVFLDMPELRNALQDRSIQQTEKMKIIRIACGDDLPSSLEEMIALIVKNEREEYLQFIAQRFIELYRGRFRLQAGKLITAIPIGEDAKEKFIERIRHITGSEIEIETTVDPGIIGGFILNLDDFRWDASVTGELNRVKQALIQ